MTDLSNNMSKKKNLKNKCLKTIIAILLSQSLSSLPLPTLADSAYIKIAGQSIFSISSAADSGSIAKRAEAIQNNLDNALVATTDRTPSSVNIAYVKGIPVITLGGYQVVTVSASDASAANTTPALLANQWADKIRNALVNQPSIDSYVAQLSGAYASSAPKPDTSTPANSQNNSANAQYGGAQSLPPPTNYSQSAPNNIAQNNAPYESYNSNSQSTNNLYNQNSYRPNSYSTAPNNSYNQNSYGSNTYQTNPNLNQTNGNYGQQQYSPTNFAQGGAGQEYRQGRIAYAQVGQIIPVTLVTSIATQVARTGDLIQASVSQNVTIGDSVIPSGSQVLGQVTDAKAGGHFTHSGELQIKFNRLRLPDGSETPISAHIVGGVGKYAEIGGDQSDQFKGETMKNKVGSVAFRGLLGAGGGAALGTAVGAIAGGGHGAGMGAWSGAAIGGGLGAADSLILRKGKDVTVPSGTSLQLQLDSPVAISGVAPAGYQ